jgi:hypothetical protein
MRFRLSLATAVLSLAAGAVAVDAQQPPPQPATQAPKQEKQARPRRGDRSKLTRQDLDEAGTSIVTARDAIRTLRPHWLQPPIGRMASSNVAAAGGGAQTVVVYVDGNRQIDLEVLNTIRNAEIHEMRYLDQNRAIGIHGPGHEAGVIEIVTVKKKP